MRPWLALIAVCVASCAMGCGSWPGQRHESDLTAATAAAAKTAQTPPTGTPPAAGVPAPGAAAASPAADPRALAEVLGELQSLGAIDPATQARLLEDMKKTDPALWPQMVQVFRASVAYRQQQAERTHEPNNNFVVRQTSDLSLPGSTPNQFAMFETCASPRPIPDAIDGALPPAAPPQNQYPSTGIGPVTTKDIQLVSANRDERPPVAPRTDAPTSGATQDWAQHLAEAIRKLETETHDAPQTSADVGKQATLRMLYVLAGRRDDALRPIAGATAAQQDFWSKELYGLATYLDVDRVPDGSRRAAEAALQLRDAASRLGEQAGLVLRNLAFCSEVNSFGVYKKFDATEFRPGQQLLLYVELENFKSEPTDKGFHTALKTSYQILDSRGARVEDQEFPATEEFCQNPRRDYFLRYFIFVPKRIYNGKYTLQLTVEDTKSQKIAQSSIEFTVKEK